MKVPQQYTIVFILVYRDRVPFVNKNLREDPPEDRSQPYIGPTAANSVFGIFLAQMKDHVKRLINPKYYDFLMYSRKMLKITILHLLRYTIKTQKNGFFSHFGRILSFSSCLFVVASREKSQKIQNFKGFQKNGFNFLERYGLMRLQVNYW